MCRILEVVKKCVPALNFQVNGPSTEKDQHPNVSTCSKDQWTIKLLNVAVDCSEELKAQTQVTTRHEEEINRLRVLLEGSANLVQVCRLLTLTVPMFTICIRFVTFANIAV